MNRARSYVFSTAFPPAVAAAATAALKIVRDEPQRRSELLDHAATLREKLSAQGWNVGAFQKSDHSDFTSANPSAPCNWRKLYATKGSLCQAFVRHRSRPANHC